MGETSMNEPQKKCIDEQEEHHHMLACLRRNYINIHMHPSSGRNIAAAVATFTTWWLFPFPHICKKRNQHCLFSMLYTYHNQCQCAEAMLDQQTRSPILAEPQEPDDAQKKKYLSQQQQP